MLGIVSCCAIVTLSLRRAVFRIFDFRNVVTLKSGLEVTQGHLLSIETLSLRSPVFEIFDFKNAVTLKTGLGVRQGHGKCHHTIERVRLPIEVL